MSADDAPRVGRDHLPDILATMRLAPCDGSTHIQHPADNYPNPFQIPKQPPVLPNDTERLFGSKCKCPNTKNSSPTSKTCPRMLEHTIVNQKQFKQRRRSDQRLLREPTLRFIEECRLHQVLDTDTTPQASTSVQDRLSSGFKNWNLDGSMADFKSLVKECESLSLSNATPDLHKTRSFRTHQVKTSAKIASSRNHPLPSTSSAHSETSQSAQQQQQPTCSQQAMMNDANCDVSIDELACYFETFVHIPKKMSSMAEMMYI